jgi:hypothetical protein
MVRLFLEIFSGDSPKFDSQENVCPQKYNRNIFKTKHKIQMKRNLHSLSANSLEFLQFANWHDVFEN